MCSSLIPGDVPGRRVPRAARGRGHRGHERRARELRRPQRRVTRENNQLNWRALEVIKRPGIAIDLNYTKSMRFPYVFAIQNRS